MYILFLALTIIYFAVTSILDARQTKKLISAPITEKVRCNWYTQTILGEWCALAAVLIMCLIAGISLEHIGLGPISFICNTWFTTITLVVCGLLFTVTAYQIISYLVSGKYREAVKEQFANKAHKGYYDKILYDLVMPRSKKEKKVFFWLSLTAGIVEEIIARGFLFFLLLAVFPHMSIILVVLIAGIIFGIGHSYQGLPGVIKTALAGMLFCCLFLVTGSLIPGILLHFFVDFSSVFLLSEDNAK